MSAKTVSGTIDVTATGAGPLRLETVSGTIDVALRAGVKPNVHHRSAGGELRVDAEAGDDIEIQVRTITGDLKVRVA